MGESVPLQVRERADVLLVGIGAEGFPNTSGIEASSQGLRGMNYPG